MEVREAQSADEWEDIVSNCFVPLRAGALSADFRGRMDHLSLDSRVSISVVTTDGTTADRTAGLAARAESDDLHLSLQRSSHGFVNQRDRTVSIRPGSVSVYATDAPYYLDYTAPRQQQLIIQVSRSALAMSAEMIASATARIATPRTPHSRVLYRYATEQLLRAGDQRTIARAEVAAVTSDLSAAMIQGALTSRRVVPHTAGGLLATILDFIEQHLTTVRVMDIAHEFLMSRRSLYLLFERLEVGPAEYLRSARLRRAADMLTSASFHHWTVGRVGAECGFPDTTTFIRAFRRAYNCTPGEWRRVFIAADGGTGERPHEPDPRDGVPGVFTVLQDRHHRRESPRAE
ncbi:AraC family transcriptional regulator [Leucobacter sp. 7(1)]|uniref:AraC family transcriptional regulator n=1 Tax=Leucobacter sp. 7(1) TaxID=1255613 RepID=UPI000B36328B|nr:AraC family transcriptional regulator [Leucobacter sp. 7(1)]